MILFATVKLPFIETSLVDTTVPLKVGADRGAYVDAEYVLNVLMLESVYVCKAFTLASVYDLLVVTALLMLESV
jgi:hypothetical protein